MGKKIYAIILLLGTGILKSQIPITGQASKVVWDDVTITPNSIRQGGEVEIHLMGNLKDGYHMYATDFLCADGPSALEVTWQGQGYTLIGGLTSKGAVSHHSPEFNCGVHVFEGSVHLVQKIKVDKPEATIAYKIDFLTCKSEEGCIPGTKQGQVSLHVNTKREGLHSEAQASVGGIDTAIQTAHTGKVVESGSPCSPIEPSTANNTNEGVNLFWYLLAAFGAGLATVFMPCIFPLLPMTISYFSKGQMDRLKTFKKAGVYGLSIIVIYTAIAILPSMLLGSGRVNNWLSTHWLPNALFFVVFVVFGLSFLGAFEITLPSRWTNKADHEADKGGYYGLFFMALTLALVSFSCTAPFLSSILILSANGGLSYKPLLGMLAYSTGFSFPFVLLAMAPKLLGTLPKSGSWMNTLKVVFGVLELALSLKFLSTIDLVYGWHVLDKGTFLIIWAVLALLLGFYLLGVFKMSHDGDQVIKLSVLRFALAATCLVASLYLMLGAMGRPVTALSGLVPPAHGPGVAHDRLCEEPMYADKLHIPHNMPGYFDIEQAKACAKAQNKKVLIDFTGHGCANCRKMEDQIWVDPVVQKEMNDKYVIASLYVDDKTELPESQWLKLHDGSVLKTLGEKNLYFETERFCEVSQPLYAVLDPETDQVLRKQAYASDKKIFLEFLR